VGQWESFRERSLVICHWGERRRTVIGYWGELERRNLMVKKRKLRLSISHRFFQKKKKNFILEQPVLTWSHNHRIHNPGAQAARAGAHAPRADAQGPRAGT